MEQEGSSLQCGKAACWLQVSVLVTRAIFELAGPQGGLGRQNGKTVKRRGDAHAG